VLLGLAFGEGRMSADRCTTGATPGGSRGGTSAP